MTGMQTAAPLGATEFRRLPIADLYPSKTNPRKHFDESYIGELSRSIAEKGLIQPIVVRPNGKPGAFEIVAGECRYRASKLANLAELPAIVREMTDAQVLEAQLEENIHRKDLTPLEEAAGYRRLIDSNPTKHTAESIATRIGMSVGYVWDRLKLNDLIPDAKRILDRGLITVGHAILIARLKHEDQMRVIHVDDRRNRYGSGSLDGMWRNDYGLDLDEEREAKKADKYAGLKPCSVRELEKWIQDHVRFDVVHAAQAQPLTFEETAAKVEAAQQRPGRGTKVIAITRDYRVSDDARDETQRTYGSESWKRADGQEKSKTCEHSVLGVFAAGENYGKTLEVCVARDKCEVHFGDVIRAKAKAAKQRASGHDAKAKKTEDKWAAQQQREREQRERDERRWKTFHPALKKAVAEKLGKLKAVNGPLYAAVVKRFGLPAATKPANFLMAALVTVVTNDLSRGGWHEKEMIAWAKLLGIDVKALEPKDESKPDAKQHAKKGSR